MESQDELKARYHEASVRERKAFWEMTAAIFDVTVRDAGAALGLEGAATPELHARADALRAEHHALEEECQRILAAAFPERKDSD